MIGQVVIAEPKDQSRDVQQYVVVKEWANALELVTARQGITCYRPIRVELDGPKAWVILGRGRCDELIEQLIAYLKIAFNKAIVRWTEETVASAQNTMTALQECLMVSKEGLVGCLIVANQPYGHERGEFIVLVQTETCLGVVSTDPFCFGKTRYIPFSGKGAWQITQTGPGILALADLIQEIQKTKTAEDEVAHLSNCLARLAKGGTP